MKINIPIEQILAKRGLAGNKPAQLYLASTVARLCDPYVPMQTGRLKAAQIASDGSTITYNQPYAHYQYNGQAMAGRAPKHYTGKPLNHHGDPMRGPQWDKRMMADRRDDVVQAVAKITGGEPK